jgi:type IV pilus assembly protein PilB
MEPEHVEPYVRASLGVADGEVFYRGIGCQHCNGTGVHGRIAAYELMPVGAEIRRLIVPDIDGDAIHAQAVAGGMVPITARALALARVGVISLREAYRIRVE